MGRNSALKLSADLIMHVLEFLDPVDILAMRATCRTFYRSAASRSVWLAALNRVCEQHGIYKPTYPMEKMTLAELEHAASGPHRFVRFVNNFDTMLPATSTQPYLTRQFQCRTKSGEAGKPDGLHAVSHLVMVPGGRFLITVQNAAKNDTAGTACLWDLGYNMNAPLMPFPVATTTAPSNVTSITVCPSLNGKDIIVAMHGLKLPPSECIVKICGIDPLQLMPEFAVHLEQVVPISGSRASICLNEPMVVVQSTKNIFVWNWADGTGCRWDYSWLDYDSDILLCGNTIVGIDDNHDFITWDIPDQLQPVIPQQGLPALISNRVKRVRRKHAGENELPSFSAAVTPSWQRHTDPHFCFIVDEQDDAEYDDRVFLHSIRRVGSHDKAFVPTYLPVEAGECRSLADDLGAEIQRSISPLILCDGRLVLCSRSESNEIVATVLPVPIAQAFDDVIEPRSAFLLQEVEEDEVTLDYDNVGFCPLSGRLVTPTSDTSLQILDFLLPMDERSTV